MTKIAGSGSGSICQRHGSADPDPPQNIMDPQHWLTVNKNLDIHTHGVIVQLVDCWFVPAIVNCPSHHWLQGGQEKDVVRLP